MINNVRLTSDMRTMYVTFPLLSNARLFHFGGGSEWRSMLFGRLLWIGRFHYAGG